MGTTGDAADRAASATTPGALLAELEALLQDRLSSAPTESYSAQLVRDPERVARKVVEEAYELAVELQRPVVDPHRVVAESADLVFHVLAGLVGARVPMADVLAELAQRRGGGP